MRRTRDLLAAALACACLPASALAKPTVSLHAALTPERLGRGATIGFGFQISAPAGRVPPPLTAFDIRYPNDLGIALSGLGVATCSPKTLAVSGAAGCPPDSRMGSGTALAEIPIGPEIVRESARVAIFRTPDRHGRIALLFYANGERPVSAQIVFPGLLLPTQPPFGGRIDTDIPLVPSLPEGPDVAVVKLRATLGPQHLTYYEHVRGRTVAYSPRGILLPETCPRGGFPFAAELSFRNGGHARAHTAVPCPARPGQRP